MSEPYKADIAAADRLLKKAVRLAIEDFRSPNPFTHAAVIETLTIAGTAAALLLGESPKRAPRKAAS